MEGGAASEERHVAEPLAPGLAAFQRTLSGEVEEVLVMKTLPSSSSSRMSIVVCVCSNGWSKL